MKKGLSFYWKLFSATFSLSAFTFGGGYIIIPLMRKKFVEQYHWIEEEEMMDLTACGKLDAGFLITHRCRLDQILEAYDVFEQKKDHVIKYAIKP